LDFGCPQAPPEIPKIFPNFFGMEVIFRKFRKYPSGPAAPPVLAQDEHSSGPRRGRRVRRRRAACGDGALQNAGEFSDYIFSEFSEISEFAIPKKSKPLFRNPLRKNCPRTAATPGVPWLAADAPGYCLRRKTLRTVFDFPFFRIFSEFRNRHHFFGMARVRFSEPFARPAPALDELVSGRRGERNAGRRRRDAVFRGLFPSQNFSEHIFSEFPKNFGMPKTGDFG